MQSLPPDFDKWKARADWILKDYCSSSKRSKAALTSLLQFCNGDTAQDVVCHWCLPGCCQSNSECVTKLLRLCIPFFSAGYGTPLLYRFKHYGPASSYMKVGCALHNLVPRTLLQMQSGAQVDDQLSSMLDVLLADTSRKYERVDTNSFSSEDIQHLVSEMMDNSVDFATQNAVRRKLVCDDVSSPNFHRNTFLVDTLLQPFEHSVNFFFSRTTILHELSALGAEHPKHDELLQKSKGMFLRTVHGDLGRELIREFMNNLRFRLHLAIEVGLQGDVDNSYLQQVFNLVVLCCTDTWRRFVAEFEGPPFSLFQLIGASNDAFVDEWSRLWDAFSSCSSCVDDTFTSTLLALFPKELCQGSPSQKEGFQQKVERLLLDIAGWCPLTSDSCEIRNGNTQWLVSRRGKTQLKGQQASVEESILQSLINTYHWIDHAVQHDTLPSKQTTSSIKKMSGSKSSNQFTKSLGKDTLLHSDLRFLCTSLHHN